MTREEAEYFLRGISYKLGNIAVEYLSEKDGEKMREAIKALEQEPIKPMVEIDLDYVIKQKYIEREVLDDIRAEVEAEKLEDSPNFCIKAHNIAVDRILQILDKYKTDKEQENGK